MALADIIAGAVAIVETAAPGARVHGYQRWAPRWDTFLGHFKTSTGIIHGWMLTRSSTAVRASAYGYRDRQHVITARGFYGLDDSANTEATFQATVDAIDAAVAADRTLGGTCLDEWPDWGPLSGVVGASIDTVDQRVFGNVLCHYAELRIAGLIREDI